VIFLGNVSLSVKEKRGRESKGKIIEVRFKDENGNLALAGFNPADPIRWLKDTKYVPILESLLRDRIPSEEGPYAHGRREVMRVNEASWELPNLLDVKTEPGQMPDKETVIKNAIIRLRYLMQVVHPRLLSEQMQVDENKFKMLVRDVSGHRDAHPDILFFYDRDKHLADSISTDVMTVDALLTKEKIRHEGVLGKLIHALYPEEMIQFIPAVLRADGSDAFFARILGESEEGRPLNWMGGVLFVDSDEVLTYMVPFPTALLPKAVFGFDIYSDSALMSDLVIQAGCNSLDLSMVSIGEALEAGGNPDELIENAVSQAKHLANLAAGYHDGESVKDFKEAIEGRKKYIDDQRKLHEEIVFLNDLTNQIQELNHRLKLNGGVFEKKKLFGGYDEGMNPDEYTNEMLRILDNFLDRIDRFGAESQRLKAAAEQLGTIIEVYLPQCRLPEKHRKILVAAMAKVDWHFLKK
jgi:hypothetical protein